MIERSFDTTEIPELDVRIQAGRVELVDSAHGSVGVRVDTDDPDFVVEQRGNLILISSDKDSGWLSRSSASVFIELPDGSDALIRTASARVDSRVRHRKIEVKTASGDVDVAGAETVIVKTASGDTSLEEVSRALRFTSASGHLQVPGALRGSAVVSTASGDIHIQDADAVIEANTVSGNIVIDRYVGRQASFKSMSGTIDLGVPQGTKLELDATLLSGRLVLPSQREGGPPKTRQMSVKAKLVSGDMTITRLDD